MTGPIASAPRIPEYHDVTAVRFRDEIEPSYRPAVLRGLVAHWPAVAAARQGRAAMADYLSRFAGGAPLNLLVGGSQIGGRFFYTDDLSGFNFTRAQITLPVLLEALAREAENTQPSALYAGSAAAADHFPGWTDENALPLATPGAIPRVWLGNASRVSTHYDVSGNIAAVVAGRRRFVLFPPEQAANLYVGPLETTMAGQPTSLVDVEAPDLDRYPRFAEAMDAMTVAELEPGDALFVPSLWWHDVRAEGALNVLVNYWWGMGPEKVSPFPALIHAILAIRDLPTGERAAMRAWFDHYVFADDPENAGRHLPPAARGILGRPSAGRTATMRGFLQRALGRA